MTNSKWVILQILWRHSHHIFSYDQPTASEWHCIFCEWQSHYMFSYDPQGVSVTVAHFVKGVSFLWLTACEWCCTFHKKQSHHIFPHGQQRVGDISHFVKGSLITCSPMTKREWVTLHIWSMTVSSFPMTNSKWVDNSFHKRQSHHIFSYDQQQVSDISYFLKGSLITSFPMTNSKWVTLHIMWKALASFHMTNSEWVYIVHFVKGSLIASFHMTNSEWVNIAHFVKGSLNASFHMTNSEWVTFHILWKAVSSHPVLWPTVCEWHCTFLKDSLTSSFPMTNSE